MEAWTGFMVKWKQFKLIYELQNPINGEVVVYVPMKPIDVLELSKEYTSKLSKKHILYIIEYGDIKGFSV